MRFRLLRSYTVLKYARNTIVQLVFWTPISKLKHRIQHIKQVADYTPKINKHKRERLQYVDVIVHVIINRMTMKYEHAIVLNLTGIGTGQQVDQHPGSYMM